MHISLQYGIHPVYFSVTYKRIHFLVLYLRQRKVPITVETAAIAFCNQVHFLQKISIHMWTKSVCRKRS